MSKKKLNIIKDLKKMKLIPTKKQQEQMLVFGACLFFILVMVLAIYGMYKYPVPHDLYYEGINYPANHWGLALYDDYIYCECGNDPLCWDIPESIEPIPEDEKYANYV